MDASLLALLPHGETDDLGEAIGPGPASSWGLVARGEAALAHGLVPFAAIDFDDALVSERPDAELEVAAHLGLCQVRLCCRR